MKFSKQDLLTLLISLFLFASCKNPDGVGLDVDPGTAIQGTLVNSEVKSRTVAESAVSTIGMSRYPLGYMIDPVFGKTESSVAMTVVPSQLSLDFGTSVLDSAVLVLRIDTVSVNTKFYGDTTNSIYSIDVYQLTNKITNFMSSDMQAHNSQLLGNFRSKIFPNTPIKVYNVIKKKTDTVKAEIRIPLNKAFIQSQIVSQPTTAFTTNAKFIDAFKGLYAQINKSSSTGVGGMAFLDFASAKSYLQLVYKKTNTTSGIDTVSVNFPIGSSTAVPVTANITHDYTGTDVGTQIGDQTSTQYNITYAQGLVGVKTKISFPNLTNFTNTYGKVVVNKAELVVDLSTGTYGYPFTAAPRLSLYRWDIAEQPTNLVDYTGFLNAGSASIFGGYYDSLKNRYIFLVTDYVQALIDKTVFDYGTFIASSSFDVFQNTPSATSAGRSVLGTNGNTANKLKLNIYYTKIN